jgi:hypothetical protein
MFLGMFPLVASLLLIAPCHEEDGEGEEDPDDPLDAGVPDMVMK